MLRYGAYAFLDEEGECTTQQNCKIDDILKRTSKNDKKVRSAYTLQKSSFNVHESGKSSAKKHLPDANDPNFWEKVLPFEGFNPK